MGDQATVFVPFETGFGWIVTDRSDRTSSEVRYEG
jgi:hypothetical protein